MKVEIKTTIELNVKYLRVEAGVRYWEDGTVNGIEDAEGDLIPCRIQDAWCPIIDVENGLIVDWEQGKTATVHYKICDDGIYTLLDENHKEVLFYEGYVPSCLQIDDNGYGDYIIISIDENGFIKNWEADFEDFQEQEY